MSGPRTPRPPLRIPVKDAFLSVPLPDEPDIPPALPGPGREPALHPFSDSAMTCPDGLVEEALWGLVRTLTPSVVPGRGTCGD